MEYSAFLLAVLCFSAAVVFLQVDAFPSGASTKACVEMVPGHIDAVNGGLIAPQESISPYGIATAATGYVPGGMVSVSITANPLNTTFQGFLLQARAEGSSDPVGTFLAGTDGSSKLIACLVTGDSITHTGPDEKQQGMSFVWQAPTASVGDIKFLLTVVQTHDVHWVRMESNTLTASPSSASLAVLSVPLVFLHLVVAMATTDQ